MHSFVHKFHCELAHHENYTLYNENKISKAEVYMLFIVYRCTEQTYYQKNDASLSISTALYHLSQDQIKLTDQRRIK